MVGIEAVYIDSVTFSITNNLTDVLIKGRRIKADCGNDGFKFGRVLSSSFVDGVTIVVLTDTSGSLNENLVQIWYEDAPHMEDGRPIVRSDTRPVGMQTYFTTAGDEIDNIGSGKEMRWDFSNNEDLYTGPDVPEGYKAKCFNISFNCPVHLKDGAIYFFDAPWGQYVSMDIVVPSGSYYPNPNGPIPAYMLGLSGNQMYAQATEDTIVQRYLNKHFMYTSCPMGDELNAEGCSVEALPVGWYIRGFVVTPESDNTSKGYGCLEMYRCHSTLLPGQTIEDLH